MLYLEKEGIVVLFAIHYILAQIVAKWSEANSPLLHLVQTYITFCWLPQPFPLFCYLVQVLTTNKVAKKEVEKV